MTRRPGGFCDFPKRVGGWGSLVHGALSGIGWVGEWVVVVVWGWCGLGGGGGWWVLGVGEGRRREGGGGGGTQPGQSKKEGSLFLLNCCRYYSLPFPTKLKI